MSLSVGDRITRVTVDSVTWTIIPVPFLTQGEGSYSRARIRCSDIAVAWNRRSDDSDSGTEIAMVPGDVLTLDVTDRASVMPWNAYLPLTYIKVASGTGPMICEWRRW